MAKALRQQTTTSKRAATKAFSTMRANQFYSALFLKGLNFNDDDFYSDSGELYIEDVKNIIIDFRDGNGNAFAKAYKATCSGTINGRGLSGFEYIVGSDYGGDVIYAGDGGSNLWGGAAIDVFITGKSQGSEIINNASIADVVWLRDVNFSDIIYTASSNGVIGIAFNTGNLLLSAVQVI